MVTMNHDTGPYNRSPTSSLPGTSERILPSAVLRFSPIVVVIERLTKAAWYRSKAMIKDVLEPEGQDHLTGSPPPHRIPPEIWMKIIAHFAYDARTLKACARTCFTWYNIAIPYLYHTLNFKQWDRDRSRTYLNPLLTSHKFGLLPFAKQVQFGRAMFGVLWVAPDVFDGEKLQYFRALENLQDLTIADLDFKKFPTGTGDYFGHFWSSLRSVSLIAPRGARRELLDFFRLFPKLDHIGISHYESSAEALDAPPPVVQGRLRGRLTLENLSDEVLLRDMIVGYGGLSFDSIVLHNVQGAQPLLEACASSLKMLQIRPSTFRNCKRLIGAGEHPSNV